MRLTGILRAHVLTVTDHDGVYRRRGRARPGVETQRRRAAAKGGRRGGRGVNKTEEAEEKGPVQAVLEWVDVIIDKWKVE